MMKGLDKGGDIANSTQCQLWFSSSSQEPSSSNSTISAGYEREHSTHQEPNEPSLAPGVSDIAYEVRALAKEIWWAHWDNRQDERYY